MEYYNLFIKVLLKEVAKFNLNIDVYSTQVTQLTNELKEDFNGPYYRCAFMYRFATANMYCFNSCIRVFFEQYENTMELFSLWKSYKEVKVCSLSVGPGLDYLGFMLAVLDYDPITPNFTDVSVVSKYGGWRNTVNFLKEVLKEQGSTFEALSGKYQNVHIVQVDLFKSLSTKVPAVSGANIILMMRTLNFLSSNPPEELMTSKMLMELISSLKSGAVIFCLDTKPSIDVITETLSHFPGQFLHEPSQKKYKVPGDFPEFSGTRPSTKAKGTFLVWQKGPSISTANVSATPLKTKSVGTENKTTDNLTAYNFIDNGRSPSASNNLCGSPMDNIYSPLKNIYSPLKNIYVGSEDIADNTSASNSVDKSPSLLNVCATPTLLSMYANSAIEEAIKEQLHLSTGQTTEAEDTRVFSSPSNSKTHRSSLDNQKNVLDDCYDLNSYSLNESPAPCDCDILSSVSSFTCENTSPGRSVQQSTYILPSTSNEKINDYNNLSENDSLEIDRKEAVGPKKSGEKGLFIENKVFQTDTLLDSTTVPSSVNALADRIRQLTISLENLSQQDDPSHCTGGDFLPFDHRNKVPGNHSRSTAKPSCSKQETGSQGQRSLPTYQNDRNAPCQNTSCHYSCQFAHNGCMHCCFQPCCAQPIQRCCCCTGNQQRSRELNFENVTAPNIVIPLQNISDDTLLQIISILRSDSKK